MARTATQNATFSKGVLDPDLSERQDLKHYYDSLADGLNLEIKPQGGVARRAGTRSNFDPALPGITARTRRRLRPLLLTSTMVTLHNGGNPSDLVDQDYATQFETTSITGDPFVIVEIDRGSAQSVAAVDLIGFSCGASSRDKCIGVQYHDGSSWVYMPGPIGVANYRVNIRTTDRTRRFCGRPGVSVTARYFRVVITGGSGLSTIRLRGMRFWEELDRISPARVFSLDRSADAIYDLVLTDRNIDVYRRIEGGARRYTASVTVPIAAHQVKDVSAYLSADTVLLFHEDIRTLRVQRQGSHFEWDLGGLPATNVPAMKPGVAFGGDQDEIQSIAFTGLTVGDRFVLVMDEEHTSAIEYSSTLTDIANEMASKLGAFNQLSGTAPSVTVADVSPATFQIAFTASGIGSRAHATVQAIMVEPSNVEPVHTIVQQGLDASGAYFGLRTGWPRCGIYTQSRLLVAGFRGAPNAWGVSTIGTFDFDDTPAGTNPLTADMAFFRALETDQTETIQQVFVGRNLQLFTDSSEWYVETRTLDATQPANAIRATGVGIKQSVRVALAEGATILVQSGGKTVRDFLYADVEQSYKAEPLSLLAPHLFSDIVDVGYRKALSTDEANLLYFINGTGTMAVISLLRAQEVIGACLHATDGLFHSVATHSNGDTLFLVERTIGGRADNFIELRDASIALDAAATVTGGAPMTTVTGLGNNLEGKQVWAYAGKQLCGPFTVTASQIVLDSADAATSVTAGLSYGVSGSLQKYRPRPDAAPPFRLPGRIYEAGFALKNTGHLEVRTCAGPWREVPLTFANGTVTDVGQMDGKDYAPDVPLLDRLFTGEITVQNLRGWSRHPRLEFRQSVPAPLHIKAIRYEVAGKG